MRGGDAPAETSPRRQHAAGSTRNQAARRSTKNTRGGHGKADGMSEDIAEMQHRLATAKVLTRQLADEGAQKPATE